MVVKLIIEKGVHCIGLSDQLKEKIRGELTIENPQYAKAVKYGRYIGPDTMPYLRYYSEDESNNIIYVPRGYIWRIKKILMQKRISHDVVDKTLILDEIDLNFTGIPRDYQEKAIKMMMGYPVGVLEAGTGAGKTFMAIGIIARRKQPTLIMVHTKELLYQWQEELYKFLDGYECGLIGDKHSDIKPITVGIIKSVGNKIDLLHDKFGHTVVDECHRCPSKTWTDTLQQFPAKRYLGLTATAFRSDGLGNAIPLFIGPIRHRVDKANLFKIGAILKPEVYRISSQFSYTFRNDYASMMKSLAEDVPRNVMIAKTIINDLRRNKKPVLCVSDRVKHLKIIEALLRSKGIDCHVLSGSISTNKRKEIIADIKSSRVKVLIATISLIGEGFDAPNLHSLHLMMPVKFAGRVIQTVGRILRPEKGKVARLYDYRDPDVKQLLYSGFGRDKIYKKEWG